VARFGAWCRFTRRLPCTVATATEKMAKVIRAATSAGLTQLLLAPIFHVVSFMESPGKSFKRHDIRAASPVCRSPTHAIDVDRVQAQGSVCTSAGAEYHGAQLSRE